MDVTKAPAPDIPAARAAEQRGSERDPAPDMPNVPSTADRVEIQPLDPAAALQILAAEVRAHLGLPPDTGPLPGPTQAAQALIRLLLDAADAPPPGEDLPVEAPVAATPPMSAVPPAEAAVLAGMDQALDVIGGWRGIERTSQEAAIATRALVIRLLSDVPPSPLWLRPEWSSLAPRIEKYWRRRRIRRGLTDPDPRAGDHPTEDAKRDAGGDE